MHEEHDIPLKWLRNGPANQDLKIDPAGLVKAPHGQACRHKAPKQALMAPAIESILCGDDKGSRDYEKWN
jgi:hypothetical protein